MKIKVKYFDEGLDKIEKIEKGGLIFVRQKQWNSMLASLD